MKTLKILALVVAGAWIGSCAPTAATMEEEGRVQFTTNELSMYLADTTHIWTPEETGGEGGAYYAPDGTLRAVWNGEYHEATYSTTNGTLCWIIEGWDDCETYFHNPDGSVSVLYRGKVTEPSPTRAGDLIDSMM